MCDACDRILQRKHENELGLYYDRGFEAGYNQAYQEMQQGEAPKAPIGECDDE